MVGEWKCNECGGVFEYPSKIVEWHDLESFPEVLYACPYCGSFDFEDYEDDDEDDEEELEDEEDDFYDVEVDYEL